ncbi:hypothetical protein ASPBRDRAFT_212097 [Aspergillus brasiliensis CBS 101740]|uniref:Uncharacterized protein n=1 Tax=Aspergillus brasiliensis (strain CBS 101740 / IMI 381727 / IBT 21946) TaxID=767769 RepID=A0A1L9U1E0_ASPBC|nr:hypothetical protein ASPBRDRAFT_212097 [Aspergillus brasiliensis CBS 101740]
MGSPGKNTGSKDPSKRPWLYLEAINKLDEYRAPHDEGHIITQMDHRDSSLVLPYLIFLCLVFCTIALALSLAGGRQVSSLVLFLEFALLLGSTLFFRQIRPKGSKQPFKTKHLPYFILKEPFSTYDIVGLLGRAVKLQAEETTHSGFVQVLNEDKMSGALALPEEIHGWDREYPGDILVEKLDMLNRFDHGWAFGLHGHEPPHLDRPSDFHRPLQILRIKVEPQEQWVKGLLSNPHSAQLVKEFFKSQHISTAGMITSIITRPSRPFHALIDHEEGIRAGDRPTETPTKVLGQLHEVVACAYLRMSLSHPDKDLEVSSEFLEPTGIQHDAILTTLGTGLWLSPREVTYKPEYGRKPKVVYV